MLTHEDVPPDDEECDPCMNCYETRIVCWCVRAEYCEDCGEYWCWCSCEREGIDVIGYELFNHKYKCRLVKVHE